MIYQLRTEKVLQQIRVKLQRLGASRDEVMRESFLVRQGIFCGRRFELDGWTAIWFVEEGEIKYYDREGVVIEVQAPEDYDSIQWREAA